MDERTKPNYNVEKLIQHLNAKWQDRPCPMCNANVWTLSDKVFEMREYFGGNLVFGVGSINPVIPVTCNNCGNSIMVNALTSGAIEKQIIEPKAQEKK